MKKFIIYPIFLLLFVNLKARPQSIIEGEYYFSKQEMVAGFNFSTNGKFQFFYAYGAVDRSAAGTFFVHGDTVKLKSNKEPGKDFKITVQSRQPAKGYTIIIDDPNKFLIKDVRCIFFTAGKKEEVYSDENGQVHIGTPACDTIYVQHTLYPDIGTLVKDKNNNNNNFRLTLNPSLEQVSFKGIDFMIIANNKLSCLPNYFMDMEGIEFDKK